MFMLTDNVGAPAAVVAGAGRFDGLRNNRLVQGGARIVTRIAESKAVKTLTVAAGVLGAVAAQAQTDATVIATNASTAFSTVAPITITIVGFYVILKIAKRVVS